MLGPLVFFLTLNLTWNPDSLITSQFASCFALTAFYFNLFLVVFLLLFVLFCNILLLVLNFFSHCYNYRRSSTGTCAFEPLSVHFVFCSNSEPDKLKLIHNHHDYTIIINFVSLQIIALPHALYTGPIDLPLIDKRFLSNLKVVPMLAHASQCQPLSFQTIWLQECQRTDEAKRGIAFVASFGGANYYVSYFNVVETNLKLMNCCNTSVVFDKNYSLMCLSLRTFAQGMTMFLISKQNITVCSVVGVVL